MVPVTKGAELMSESYRTSGRANLYRVDGSRRPDAEVLAESGDIGLRLALLDEAMHLRATSVEVDALYPPRLFLSYKWGNEKEDAWVMQLAADLTQRGWDVVFDRKRDETVDPNVEDFVSRLTNCRVFVAVLSPAYIASAFAASHPTWVYDEMQCALIARDRMRLIGLVPPRELATEKVSRPAAPIEMPRIPAIIIQPMQETHFDVVFEADNREALEGFLDSSLTYTGPRLTATEQSWVKGQLARDADEDSLQEVVGRYPFIIGAWRRLVLLLSERGELESALEATRKALPLVDDPIERLSFLHENIELLKRCGDRNGAAQAATQLIEARPDDWVAHFHLGDVLDDANEFWPARSHLLLACRQEDVGAAAYNALGVIYMGLGLLARAEETLAHVLELDSSLDMTRSNLGKVIEARARSNEPEMTEVTGPLPGCSECEAIFVQHPDRPWVCANCGASKSAAASLCEICGEDGVTPIVRTEQGYLPARCPICRTGTITAKMRAVL
jgi:tetratricopeptide (TPR) repeat protein